jgi:hypothetical protein
MGVAAAAMRNGIAEVLVGNETRALPVLTITKPHLPHTLPTAAETTAPTE